MIVGVAVVVPGLLFLLAQGARRQVALQIAQRDQDLARELSRALQVFVEHRADALNTMASLYSQGTVHDDATHDRYATVLLATGGQSLRVIGWCTDDLRVVRVTPATQREQTQQLLSAAFGDTPSAAARLASRGKLTGEARADEDALELVTLLRPPTPPEGASGAVVGITDARALVGEAIGPLISGIGYVWVADSNGRVFFGKPRAPDPGELPPRALKVFLGQGKEWTASYLSGRPLGQTMLYYDLLLVGVGVAVAFALIGLVALGNRHVYALSRAYAEVEASRRQYFSLVQESVEAVFVCDPEARRFLEASEQGVALTGYSRERLLAVAPTALHPADQAQQARAAWSGDQASAAGAELTMVRADGSEVPVEVLAKQVLFGGKPAILASVRDLSQRKALESERLVAERLAGALATSVTAAHEINNPLAALAANVRFLAEQGADPQEQQQILAEILAAAERIQKVVQQLSELKVAEFTRYARGDAMMVDLGAPQKDENA